MAEKETEHVAMVEQEAGKHAAVAVMHTAALLAAAMVLKAEMETTLPSESMRGGGGDVGDHGVGLHVATTVAETTETAAVKESEIQGAAMMAATTRKVKVEMIVQWRRGATVEKTAM